VTGPQEIASVSTPASLCAAFRSQGSRAGQDVWLRTRADFDPKLNLDLSVLPAHVSLGPRAPVS
jgi:hypothetical protein